MNNDIVQYFLTLPVHEMEDLLKQVSRLRYEQELGNKEIEQAYGADSVESPRIPEFIELMHKSINVHIKKNKDYASAENPFSNFERSAEIASWFLYDSDKSFAILVGTKLARIAELTDGRLPNNESLDDSFLDLVTYCALWGALHKRFKTGSPLNTVG